MPRKRGLEAQIERAEEALAQSLGSKDRAKEEAVEEYMGTATLQDAKNLYMRFVPLSKIVGLTEISQKILKQYIRGINGEPGWEEERKEVSQEISLLVRETTIANLKKASHLGLGLIERALEAVASKHRAEETEPTLDEAIKITKIFEALFRSRVTEEKNRPPGEDSPFNPQKLIETLTNDPYIKAAFVEKSDGPPPEGDAHKSSVS